MIRIFKNLFLFIKNCWGSVSSPYATYRRISDQNQDIYQTGFIFLFIVVFFALSSLIKEGFHNPFLLTIKFNSLVIFFTFNFVTNILLLNFLGKNVGGDPKLRSLYLLWSYSLIPTIAWFYFTSSLYIILPPPRSLTILGKIYSVFYIIISIALLYWKLILYYLTIRFGIKVDLGKIVKITMLFFPYLFLISSISYKLGIFKIPFI